MGRIHFMEYQNKYVIEDIKQFSVSDEVQLSEYINIISETICKADLVYLYRTHKHINEENELIKWTSEFAKKVEYVSIFVEKYGKELKLKSVDGRGVLVLDINEDIIRESFINKFFICCTDYKHCVSDSLKKLQIITFDPKYDQYDYLFVKNNKVILWTSIHELMVFISEDYI